MTLIIILLCVGLIAGILSGMVGIGGGIVIVPALVYFLGYSQHQAQGTTLALMLLPIGILAVSQYYKAGCVDIKTALIIAFAFTLGGFLGAKLSLSINEQTMKKVFGALLLVIAIKMISGK